jgi:predicted lipoprotein
MRHVLIFCLLVAALGGLSCGGDAGPAAPAQAPEVQDMDVLALRQGVLGNFADIVVADLERFGVASRALEEAAGAWGGSGALEDRERARAAWREATLAWQGLELMQVGPAGLPMVTPGGEGLRDELYSWPLINRCRVDQELVEAAYEDVDAFAQERVNVRGLDALEYLLFAEGDQNACAPNSAINRDGEWAALGGAVEIDRRRARYAATLAALLRRQGEALLARWTDADGMRDQLTDVGSPGNAFGTTQEALNAFSDALFYLDKEAKDMKLAIPLGLSQCEADTCPEALEARLSGHSGHNLLMNVRGFARIFAGTRPDGSDGPGFDDLLRDLGADALVDEVLAALADADAEALALSEDLDATLARDPAAVQRLYDAIKRVTDLLKTQLLGMLDLELPNRAEGDND